VSPVPLSVAPSRDTDGGIVGLSEVTHPDDNRIEVADGSQRRRPSIRTSAGGSACGHQNLLSAATSVCRAGLCVVTGPKGQWGPCRPLDGGCLPRFDRTVAVRDRALLAW